MLLQCFGHPISAAVNFLNDESSTGIPVNVEFSIDDIEFHPSFEFRGVSARCSMLALRDTQVGCTKATLVIERSPVGKIVLAAQIRWRPESGMWVLDAQGDVGAAAKLVVHLERTDGGTHVSVDLAEFELPLVRQVDGAVPQVWPDYPIETGILTLKADCRFGTGSDRACKILGRASNLNLNGVSVAENVTADFDISYAVEASAVRLEFDISLHEGAVYIEPGFKLGSVNPGFFLAVADAPINVSARVTRSASGEIHVLAADLSHPGVVDMGFTGDLAFLPAPQWRDLNFMLAAGDVKKFYSTYMQPVALDTAFGSLETAGGIYVKLVGSANEIDHFDIRFDDVYIDDDKSRFSLYGLDGEIELHAGDETRESHIGWIGGALYKIQIGPGRIDWVSAKRGLKAASWQDVTIFDGEFRMDTLEIEHFSLANTKVALSGTLTPITLSALTSAFGWMPLSGKLSGSIPQLTYSANRLAMDGDLNVNVFDGQIIIGELQVDELFSTVPLLSANVSFRQLDLEELTRTFSFGNISGRLDGKIDDLVLQAWRPIRFDSSFATPEDDDSPHRISRQAVDNLGRLGAGTGSALSQGWLSLIPSYSYGRLGIACKLINGNCLMSGIEDAADGNFFILTRGGILPPWIDIKGSGRKIKWQTLVDGIKQISRGKFELDIGMRDGKKIH